MARQHEEGGNNTREGRKRHGDEEKMWSSINQEHRGGEKCLEERREAGPGRQRSTCCWGSSGIRRGAVPGAYQRAARPA